MCIAILEVREPPSADPTINDGERRPIAEEVLCNA
jgi:hypothetical protein